MNLLDVQHPHPHEVSPSAVCGPSAGNGALCERAIRWLLPWTHATFPGFRKGILSMLPGFYAWQAVQHWRRGRRRLPAGVAEAMADAIRSRRLAGELIEAELRAYAVAQRAMRRPAAGCCRVDNATGRDRRGSWRR